MSTTKQLPPDYEERCEKLGLTKEEELKQILSQQGNNNVVILDVRSGKEIDETGSFTKDNVEWLNIPCMPTDVTQLQEESPSKIPNKDASIVVYCRSGNRAVSAIKALQEQGYTKVYNAGGYNDLVNMDL
jgi:phage shock protein E